MSFLTNPIKVLYEDDCFMAFDKPAGLLVIPTPKNEPNTLINIVNYQYARKDGSYKLHLCHRLDRETSGVILCAKGKHDQQLMMGLFEQRVVKKTYILFVYGRLAKPVGEIKTNIRDLDQKKFNRRAPAQSAITRYKTLDMKKSYSVVEAEPVTGRTNQIRIQFSQIGHHLVGDRKYAFVRDYGLKFRRTALHAKSLEWEHPVTHQKIIVQSDLPKDMEVFLARNRN